MKIKQLLILSAATLSLAACGGHTHTFASEWTYDETSHWHAATCEHTDEKSEKADHLDANTDGKCDVCNHDVEVPTPAGAEVTQAEWEAAFGVNDINRPYLFAENYFAEMHLIMSDETVYPSMYQSIAVDGLKAKKTNKEQATYLEATFYEKVGNTFNYFEYYSPKEKWVKYEDSPNPSRDFSNFLEPFENYSQFTFNKTDSTYKCAEINIGETLVTNLVIKFVDKKIISAEFDSLWSVPGGESPFHWTFEITYGGQSVTLPEVDPEPSGEEYKVTENQFNTAFSLEALNNVTITTSVGSFSQTCEADGTKEFNVNYEPYDFYLSLEDGIMYKYKQEDNEWVKNQQDGTTYARQDMIKMFGNVYNQLTFDEDSNSYRGTNISIEGAVRYSEVEYCFEHLKVVAIYAVGATGSVAGQRMIVSLTKYGQTIVTLPQVE